MIHPYLKRREGLEPITYPNQEIKDVLSKTLGVIIFQEQLMRIAIALGDFTAGEANELRKNIGAWNSKSFQRNLNPYTEKLLQGLKRRKIPQSFIDQMVSQMQGFSHYGFPESHAISFAFLAYASCYLKCHYPAAFFTAILNSQPMGFYSPQALIQTARRQKIKILPIDVNASIWDHQLEEVDAKPGQPKIFGIRLGFRLVSGLSQKAVDQFLGVRANHGLWTSLDHFIQTTSIYRDDYSALAAANAFQSLGVERFDALWRVEAVPYKDMIDVDERRLKWKSKSSLDRTQMDFKATGVSLETHPSKVLREHYWSYDLDPKTIQKADQLVTADIKKPVHVFGMTLIKQAPPSAKGMVFLTLEDETGFINLAFAPNTYKTYYKLIEGYGFLCVTGKLQKVGNYQSILVTRVHDISRLQSHQTAMIQPVENEQAQVLKLKPRNYY